MQEIKITESGIWAIVLSLFWICFILSLINTNLQDISNEFKTFNLESNSIEEYE